MVECQTPYNRPLPVLPKCAWCVFMGKMAIPRCRDLGCARRRSRYYSYKQVNFEGHLGKRDSPVMAGLHFNRIDTKTHNPLMTNEK